MEVLLSKLVRTLVFDDEGRPFTSVVDLIIEPSGGKLVGIVVGGSRNLMISPMDVEVFSAEKLVVIDRDVVAEIDDVVRAREVVSKGFYFLNCAVYDKEGVYLGKVFDYAVDMNGLCLKSIWVAKGFWNLVRYDKRRFDWEDIFEVKPGKIVVEGMRKVFEKEPQPVVG